MKKIIILICMVTPLLTGFEQADNLEITNVETTLIKATQELRYDFTIANTGDVPIESDFDYPGHNPFGIELAVRPNDELSNLMEMDDHSEFNKMKLLGSGSRGFFPANSESFFHVSYQIKDDVDFEKVRELALDATLLILDGTDVSIEFPLHE